MDAPIRTFTNQTNITSISVANNTVLIGSELNNSNQGVYTYSLTGGQIVQTLSSNNEQPTAVALSSDGRSAVASTSGFEVILWNSSTGQLIKSLPGPGAGSDNSSRVAFTPDGQMIISAYSANLTVFDTVLAQKNKYKVLLPGATLFSITPSPEGRFVAAGYVRFDNGNDVVVYDLLSGQPRLSVASNKGSGVTCLAWNGNNILTGSGTGTIQLLDAQTGATVSRQFPKHARTVKALAIAADGRLALSGSDDGTTKVIEIATGRELKSFNHADGQVQGVAFADNGKTAVSCGGKTLKLWDLSGL